MKIDVEVYDHTELAGNEHEEVRPYAVNVCVSGINVALSSEVITLAFCEIAKNSPDIEDEDLMKIFEQYVDNTIDFASYLEKYLWPACLERKTAVKFHSFLAVEDYTIVVDYPEFKKHWDKIFKVADLENVVEAVKSRLDLDYFYETEIQRQERKEFEELQQELRDADQE